MAKTEKATKTYKALKEQLSVAAERKAGMAEKFKTGITAVNAEIASLERQLNVGVSGMEFDDFQKAHGDLDAAFNKMELLEKQQKAFEKTPFIAKSDYQAFLKSLSDERKATEAAAEAEIFDLLKPLAGVAEKYTTIINELRSLEYVYKRCFGKENGDNLAGWGLTPYFPELLNDVNKLLASAFNRYAKANDEDPAAMCDIDEVTVERTDLLKIGQLLDSGDLPETRIVDRLS